MADANLIKGAATLAKSKRSIGAGMDLSFKGVSNANLLAAKQRQETKMAAQKSAVNTYMENLSDIDLSGFNQFEQQAMTSFLTQKKNQYAYAASEISKIDDATDPEYIFFRDSMNAINNSIANLKAQTDAYQKNKENFVKSNEMDLWSNGNDANQTIDKSISIYGLTGDDSQRAAMGVDDNGNLTFEINGEVMAYKDYKDPFIKDFELANYIADKTSTLFNAHKKLNEGNANALRLELEAKLASPNSIKSIISSDFRADWAQGLSDIVFNPEDIAGTRNQIIDRLMIAFTDVANKGYNERGTGRGTSSAATSRNSWIQENNQYTNSNPPPEGEVIQRTLPSRFGNRAIKFIPTITTEDENGEMVETPFNKWVVVDMSGNFVNADLAFDSLDDFLNAGYTVTN